MGQTDRTLLDRGEELDAINRVLRETRNGLSRALVIRGEAGIRKSVLLEHAVQSAPDLEVTRVVAAESEMELAYAGLHLLLMPFLSYIGSLPAPQRDALRSALGLSAGSAPDRFMVG